MDDTNYHILLDEVRQNFASVVWTHKIQEKQADIYAQKYKWLETTNILFSAATSCGIVATIFTGGITAKIISAVLSFVTLSITAYFKSFDLKGMEQRHRNAANNFIVIRNRLLHVISSLHMKDDFDEIYDEYKSTLSDLNKLYPAFPRFHTRLSL